MKASHYTKETIRDLGMSERNFDAFKVGDAIQVDQIIKEGGKERIQIFEGDVLAFRNNGVSTTFTVRRIGANNVPIERVFAYYSPTIATVRRVHQGVCRRAKLFYMRDRIGRAARVQEKIFTKEQKAQAKK
jgi:large subunit ribosomal protein L19